MRFYALYTMTFLYDTRLGKKLLKHFEDSDIGLIGVAGTRFKSKYNSGWGCSPMRLRANVQETSPDGILKKCHSTQIM